MERGKHTEFEIKIRDSIAKNLKKLLIEKRMTQKKLSELTGIPTSTISDYLNARSLALPANVNKLAIALQVLKSEIDPSYGEAIEIPLVEQMVKIPLVGTICAGEGLLAESNIEEYICYPFPGKKQPDFALRVKGDSMNGVGIEDGDVVYLRKAPWAEYNGQIVAALINDQEDGMLKRIKWTEGSPSILLVPENDKYQTKELYPNEISISGLYMGHFKPEKD